MNVKTEQSGGVSIVRVGETRLMYPILSDFSSAVSGLVAAGKREILIDLDAGHLRGQRDDRLPDGSVPAGAHRRRRT